MSFYIKLDGNDDIELPNNKTLEERIALCNEIIDKYPEYFEQKLQIGNKNEGTASYKTMLRLSIMADYLLACDTKKGEYSTLSDYKIAQKNDNEITFSDFDGKYSVF